MCRSLLVPCACPLFLPVHAAFVPKFHYDWGLRAVKSVLLVAGKLKRSDPDIDEEAVLMRALRDFNTPKVCQSVFVYPFVSNIGYTPESVT